MFTSEDFYKSFQLNFFDYKQHVNEYLLNQNKDTISKITKGIYYSSVEEFKLSVKMDIRMTSLMAMDTLFELIFALLPDYKQRIQDDNILHNLSKKQQYYRDLGKYLNGSKGRFEALKWSIDYHNKKKNTGYRCSVLRHLFYKGIFENQKEEEIKHSIEVIEKLLKMLGKEINENREELNSFKHGLRVFPYLKNFYIRDADEKDHEIQFDLSNSISYLTIDKHQKLRTINTSQLKPDRDLTLTAICSNLIYNMIITRKTDLENFKINGQRMAFLFSDVIFEELNKLQPKINNLRINLG